MAYIPVVVSKQQLATRSCGVANSSCAFETVKSSSFRAIFSSSACCSCRSGRFGAVTTSSSWASYLPNIRRLISRFLTCAAFWLGSGH